MNHYLIDSNLLENLPFGFAFGPTDAEVSLAVVTGQHGDEYAGLRAGSLIARSLASWAIGAMGVSLGVPVGLDRVRVLVAPALNGEGIALGTRAAADGRDLNRCWPDRHPTVAPVWDAIVSLPGSRRVLVDIHGTTINRDSDPSPDCHLFVAPACESLFAPLFLSAWGELIVVPTDPAEDLASGTLEGAALAAGFEACTLEIGEDDGRGSARAACLMVSRLIEAIAD